jgi:hypothetical protein
LFVFDTANKLLVAPLTILLQSLSAADVLIVQVVPSGDVITLLPPPELATATNKFKELFQTIPCQLLSVAEVREVQDKVFGSAQVIPLLLVITLSSTPEVPTATNKELRLFQAKLVQELSAAEVLDVHTVPSGLVITLLPVPLLDTATKRPSEGLHSALVQLLSTGVVLVSQLNGVSQLIPSKDTIALLPDPVLATATNELNSGTQITLFQALSAAEVLAVQVIASGLVITLLFVPLLATATKRPSVLLQVILE